MEQRPTAVPIVAGFLFAAAAGDAIALFVTPDRLRSASGILVPAAFLYALTRHPVRHYFTHERQ
jgi:hypothetical protein